MAPCRLGCVRRAARTVIRVCRGDAVGLGWCLLPGSGRRQPVSRSRSASRRPSSDSSTPAVSALSAAAPRRFYAGTRATVCNQCFRHTNRRVELALADTANYSKGALNACTSSRCFNGRRTKVPRSSEFRVIEFREHGIPISTPRRIGPHIDTSRRANCGAPATRLI